MILNDLIDIAKQCFIKKTEDYENKVLEKYIKLLTYIAQMDKTKFESNEIVLQSLRSIAAAK
ncbi:hypothetical protein ACFL5N_00200 [bacterium]